MYWHSSKVSNTTLGPIFQRDNKSTIKPIFRTRTDISRRLATTNKTNHIDYARLQRKKSNLKNTYLYSQPIHINIFSLGKITSFLLYIHIIIFVCTYIYIYIHIHLYISIFINHKKMCIYVWASLGLPRPFLCQLIISRRNKIRPMRLY